MMQLYFLSVLLNIFVSILLLNSINKENDLEAIETTKKQKLLNDVSKKISASEFLQNSTITLIVAILSVVVGILKLFVVAGESPVILGDLFPSFAGICGGFSLLLNYFIKNSNGEVNLPKFIKSFFLDKAYIIGFCCFIISILHFFLPRVIFF